MLEEEDASMSAEAARPETMSLPLEDESSSIFPASIPEASRIEDCATSSSEMLGDVTITV